MRRPDRWRDGLALAVLAVVAFLPVAIHLSRSAPEPLGVAERIGLAQEVLGARALAERTVPLWNPFEFGGRPHLADLGTRALYLPHVALRVLPLSFILPVSFWFHAWIAGVGAYFTARYLSLSRPTSFVASLAIVAGALAPGGEMPYAPEIYRLAWVPLILAFVLRSAQRSRLLPHPALVIVTSLAMTASSRGPLIALTAVIVCGFFVILWPPAGATTRRLAAQLGLLPCLAAGLTAFLLIPAARLEASADAAGGFVSDAPGTGSRHPRLEDRRPVDRRLTTALAGLHGEGRLLSACDEVIDSTHLIPLGIADAGGTGGVVSADFARVTNLARGPAETAQPVYRGIREAGSQNARNDLLRLMAVEYLVSCAPADPRQWALVAEWGDVGVYRSLQAAPRAFWTCSPEAVGREELEYRLRRGTYDDRLTLHTKPLINVRWPAGLHPDERNRIEAALHIDPQRDLGERTWLYALLDASPANVVAIVTHPSVEDTQGIDRGSRTLMPPPLPRFDDAKTDWLVGGRPCDEFRAATVLKRDRLDGSLIVAVDAPREGVVFLSETWDADRTAWLDGGRVEPLKLNFAFTGIPVTGGIHRIVLGYDRRPFLFGVGVSVMTLAVWAFGEWQVRR